MRFKSSKELLSAIGKSRFRSSFKLKGKELAYAQDKGIDVLQQHARDFIKDRLAPAQPVNDGKQTPTRNHPVFIAQHATGTCCRGCLEKWHRIPKGTELTLAQQEYIVRIIMWWIENELSKENFLF